MFLTIQEKPFEHTVQAFQNSDAVDGIVIVVREAELAQVQQMVPQKVYPKIIDYAGGGQGTAGFSILRAAGFAERV